MCPCSIPLELPHSCVPPTTGPLCRSCTPGFYRSAATCDECVPCNCDPNGSFNSGTCDSISGQCKCRPGRNGRQCDSCPPGYLGPSSFLVNSCIKCFCNGFASVCDAEDGWYQAQVSSVFEEKIDIDEFTSPGEIKYNSE